MKEDPKKAHRKKKAYDAASAEKTKGGSAKNKGANPEGVIVTTVETPDSITSKKKKRRKLATKKGAKRA